MSLVRGTTRERLTVFKPDLQFQSTSLVRGTTGSSSGSNESHSISIHVPRERDDPQGRVLNLILLISIHVPRERDDRVHSAEQEQMKSFQSTSLVRGTTYKAIPAKLFIVVISIHVPRERDDRSQCGCPRSLPISIHVPRERDDSSAHTATAVQSIFQSTSLVRGTTSEPG